MPGILDLDIKPQQPAAETPAEHVAITNTTTPSTETPSKVYPNGVRNGRELLKIENLNLTLGKSNDNKTDILKNVNATIYDRIVPGETRGQIVGILGPSGVGKTKLFECISGLRLAADTNADSKFNKQEGSVHILDRNESGLVPVEPGRVGVVMQQYPLFEWRTVGGNLMVALEGKKLSKEEKLAKVHDILKNFKMEDKFSVYPNSLSGAKARCFTITASRSSRPTNPCTANCRS